MQSIRPINVKKENKIVSPNSDLAEYWNKLNGMYLIYVFTQPLLMGRMWNKVNV